MSLSIGGGTGRPASARRGSALASSSRSGEAGAEWLPLFGRRHQAAVTALLLALLCAAAVAPAPARGAGLLLVGGALIGIPHGSSDFVVAHRELAPRFGRAWLPTFLAAYLAAVGVTLAGWALAPAVTFGLFLAVSGFHFGAPEDEPPRGDDALRYLARALTPVLPIVLCHPGEVASIIALMTGRSAETMTATLASARPLGISAYAALLALVAVCAAARDGTRASARWRETAELILLAMAAVALPPLVTFAVFFCLIHAVRHMAHLGYDRFPRRPGAALGLAAAIVLPSALACGLVLAFAWDAVAGVLSTDRLLAAALQLTAALTVPHVALEWWTTRKSG